MARKSNAELVANAIQKRRTNIEKSFALDRAENITEASVALRTYGPWARELNHVNNHITVRPEEFTSASNAYLDVANHLVKELDWPIEAIRIIPQGSASTQTLIRSPGKAKFDIDAVCQVDISRIEAKNPVGFFDSVGEALAELEAIAKKRCWNIPYTNEPFYLEFTPSVPIGNVSTATLSEMAPRFQINNECKATALAVVDNPTKQWKTSNPAGFTKWVSDTAARQLLRTVFMEAATYDSSASIDPVPSQQVELSDTLRVAIRLFKRHRDINVHRGLIDGETKPISVIIVTLLTACYAGLAEQGRTFTHPIQLLLELAELLPGMIDVQGDGYHVDNPTVDGENFAERWNQDNGERFETFSTWCDMLAADMQHILDAPENQVKERVERVFGCGPSGPATSGPANGSGSSGLTPSGRRAPVAPPVTNGLA